MLMGVFFLFLGVLNYFNILSLKKAFPFLASLPRKHQIIQEQKIVNTRPPYHYDTTAVNNALETFAKATLQSVYLPDKLTINPTVNTAPHSVTSAFFDSWQKKSYTFGIQASYQKGTAILQQLTISSQLPSALIPPSPLTASESSTLLNALFLRTPPDATFTCIQQHHPRTLDVTDFCQSFHESDSEKIGYGVIIYRTSPSTGQLFSCEIFNNNPSYNTYNTCLNP